MQYLVLLGVLFAAVLLELAAEAMVSRISIAIRKKNQKTQAGVANTNFIIRNPLFSLWEGIFSMAIGIILLPVIIILLGPDLIQENIFLTILFFVFLLSAPVVFYR